MVANYEGFDVRQELTSLWAAEAASTAEEYYETVRRFSGRTFLRAKMAASLAIPSHDEAFKVRRRDCPCARKQF